MKPERLDQPAMEALLSLLDADRERAGAVYEDVRRRLVRLFQWRGLPEADVLADETLSRAAVRLEEGIPVTTPDPFAYLAGVARFVAMEAFRRLDRERQVLRLEDWRAQPPESDDRLDCFERCLDALPAKDREQILGYYDGEGRALMDRRERIAADLGIPLGALRVRAHRLRAALAGCTRRCLGRPGHVRERQPATSPSGGAT